MKYGADINIKSHYNKTSLSFECRNRDKDLINYILLHGVNMNINNCNSTLH